MVSSIGYSLGAGSGIDTKTLVEELAAAAKAPKEALLKRREEQNGAKVSALAEVSNAIDSFASALSALVSGGTLFTQPSVSDPTVLGATAIAGKDISGLAAQLEVRQLAQSQTLESAGLASSSAAVGEGDLTLVTAAGSFTVTINSANNSLAGLADAINAKKAGVTASIVTQAGSARLVLKGATGEINAFTLDVPAGTTSGLERFAFGPSVTGGLTSAQEAKDAIVRLDGVEVQRSSNSFNDLIPGVELNLKRAMPGTTVALGVTRPTAAISQAVNDFVTAYNELHRMLAAATAPAGNAGGAAGPLRGDLSVRDMQRQLSALPSTVLSSSGGPSTLAEIGVATNRDGTLRVQAETLQAALARDPDGVEAMFNPRQHSSSPLVSIMNRPNTLKPGVYTLTDLLPNTGSGASGKINNVAMTSSGSRLIGSATSAAPGLIIQVDGAVASATLTFDAGLGGALQAIRDSVRSRSGPMAGAQERLTKEAETIADDREAFEMRSEAYYNQLVKNFAAMERRVSAFKATQSYLEQQVKMWTNSND